MLFLPLGLGPDPPAGLLTAHVHQRQTESSLVAAHVASQLLDAGAPKEKAKDAVMCGKGVCYTKNTSFIFYFCGMLSMYNVVLLSAAQQSDPVIHISISYIYSSSDTFPLQFIIRY